MIINVEEQFSQLEATILAFRVGADLTRIRTAFEFARNAHASQMR